MESKAIPTVEEFIISKEVFDGILYSPLHKREFKLSELLHEYAVLFAKYHVKLALEAASEQAMMTHHCGRTKENKPINYYQVGPDNVKPCKDSIENAYDQNNIK